MKYIRTKDGHIYCEKDEMTGKLLEVGYYSRTNESPIMDVADTIEKLCDVFVIKEPDGTYRTMPLKLPCGVCENETLYGHIWVNDNLIKVAKMNEKGELELLWDIRRFWK